MGKRCEFEALIFIATAFLFFACKAAQAEKFIPECEHPTFPSKATAVDQRCGLKGAGGVEAEQNDLKNNFCANGPPTVLTFERLKELQSDVEKNKVINFGDRANHGGHGPTQDRAPLKALGEGTLVELRAYVLAAKQEGAESVNCGKTFDRLRNKNAYHDIHISIVETKDLSTPSDRDKEKVNECHGVVVEMVPHHRPPVWTATNVNKVRNAHLPVRITGQLFFDSSHVPCSGDTPVRTNPKRFSLWEIHPIYKFEVCVADCNAHGTWMTLENWLTQH